MTTPPHQASATAAGPTTPPAAPATPPVSTAAATAPAASPAPTAPNQGVGHLPPTGTTPTAAPTEPGWLHACGQFSAAAHILSGRPEMVVTIAPGAGQGAPGCQQDTSIELDGTLLPVPPASIDLNTPGDPDRYPALYGVLVHECAHAAHTRWDPPPLASLAATDAALLLEEIRIERRQTQRRPGDRRWLRRSAADLVLGGIPTGVALTRWEAARLACLAVGRVDGGILDTAEIEPLARMVVAALGDLLVGKLRRVWLATLRTRDTSGPTMLRLGARWCRLLGADPNATGPTGPATATVASSTTPVRDAAAAIAAAVLHSDTAQQQLTHDSRARAETRRAQIRAAAARKRTAANTARRPDTTGLIGPPRAASDGERWAVRKLTAALEAAAHRDPVRTRIAAPTPPGRLQMRAARSADAQRAAGQHPTALPFRATARRRPPIPPLRVGICCDVSGSMRRYTAAVGSAAWMLHTAAAHAALDAASATVLFGPTLTALTHPGQPPTTQVRTIRPAGGTSYVADAIDAVDHLLELSTPGPTRLAVMISDGCFDGGQHQAALALLAALRATGCGLLWLAPPDEDIPLPGGAARAPLTDDVPRLRDLLARAVLTALNR